MAFKLSIRLGYMSRKNPQMWITHVHTWPVQLLGGDHLQPVIVTALFRFQTDAQIIQDLSDGLTLLLEVSSPQRISAVVSGYVPVFS